MFDILNVFDETQIREQICNLLNSHLFIDHALTPDAVLLTKYMYTTRQVDNKTIIVGVGGSFRKNNGWTILKHLAVHPDFRRQGIAQELTRRRVEVCTTPMLYALINKTNKASLKNSISAGFFADSTQSSKREGQVLIKTVRCKDDNNNNTLREMLKVQHNEIMEGVL